MDVALLLLLTELMDSPASSEQMLGKCHAEAERILGRNTVIVVGKVRPPKLLRQVAPRFPKRSTTRGEGFWLGQGLIDTKGNVVRVWTIREPRFDPPWPEFSEAISGAVLQWKYRPAVVDGVPVPVCVLVRTTIDWR